MIKVALGTENFQFTRVMEWLERAIDDGAIPTDEEILVQAGSTSYSPKYSTIKMTKTVPYEQQMQEFRDARLCITHAGIGNVLDMVDLERVPIIVPRDPMRKEHLDGHQLDFCEIAGKELNLPIAYTYQEFVDAIKNYNADRKFPTFRQQLVEFLISAVES